MITETTQPTVYVVDDDPFVRSSVEKVILAHGYRVECFENAEKFLESAHRELRGCILLDVRMPGISGLQLLERLREMAVDIPAIMLTGYAEIPDCVQALKHGAVDFLEKPYRSRKLLDAIEAAMAVDIKIRSENSFRQQLVVKINSLSVDERLVLDGIVEGKIQRRIASDLDVSLRTVQFRRSSILKKLGVGTSAELLQLISEARTMGIYRESSGQTSQVG